MIGQLFRALLGLPEQEPDEPEFVFEDRYSATGRRHNGCDTCEGMGCLPVRKNNPRADLRALWHAEPEDPDALLPEYKMVD